MTMLRLCLAAAMGAAVLAAAPKVVGGPFVVNTTARGATVAWIVESDEVTFHAAGAAAKTSPALQVEYTNLTGLQPNTRYEYEAGGQKGSFKTPPNGAEPFRLLVFGDDRTRHDIHRQMVARILQNGVPDLMLHTGDLVENGWDSSLWKLFFEIERDLLRQTAFFPAQGNHERNSRDFYQFFQQQLPYYSFNWGNAHFTVFSSDLANASGSKIARDAFWAEQTKWMEEDLAANQKADYRFVAAHHAPYTAVERRQGDNPHITALVPLWEKYHVTAGLFGHDHNYQHYLKNGVHYIVSGGGGAPLYDVNKPDPAMTQKVASVENFVSVSFNGKTAKAQAIDINGKVIDEFEFHASGQ
jgi:3',5'-cyclic AMP phosphodiesterase CpdA